MKGKQAAAAANRRDKAADEAAIARLEETLRRAEKVRSEATAAATEAEARLERLRVQFDADLASASSDRVRALEARADHLESVRDELRAKAVRDEAIRERFLFALQQAYMRLGMALDDANDAIVRVTIRKDVSLVDNPKLWAGLPSDVSDLLRTMHRPQTSKASRALRDEVIAAFYAAGGGKSAAEVEAEP